MLLLLLALLLYPCDCKSVLDIKDAGIGHINKGDVGLLFYLTLKNKGEQNLQISIKTQKCCEKSHKRISHLGTRKLNCNMLIIGGTMGTLKKGHTKNVTLVYPNMYLMNREGTCTLEVKYENENYVESTTTTINFNTYTRNSTSCRGKDRDSDHNCEPQDCVAKYAGDRNFFNYSCGRCQPTPMCRDDLTKRYPQKGYSIVSNRCVNLKDNITKYQALMLIMGKWYKNHSRVPIHNLICHHGYLDKKGRCNCVTDWSTTLDDDLEYYPSLLQYHMCNIETSSWNRANKGRMKTTALIVAILAVAIASKVLVFMCIVGWCYKQLRHSLSGGSDDDDHPCHVCNADGSLDDASIVLSDSMDLEECLCDEMSTCMSPVLQNETFNCSFIPSTSSSSYGTGSYGTGNYGSCSFASGENPPSGGMGNPRSVGSDKKELHVSYVSSVHLSHTSSSLPISFETGSDESSEDESDFTDEDDEDDDEDDYDDDDDDDDDEDDDDDDDNDDDDDEDDDDDSELELSDSDEEFCHCEEDRVDQKDQQEDEKGSCNSVKSKNSQNTRHSEKSRHSEKKEQ